MEGIHQTGCNQCEVYQPIDVKIKENTIVQPDVSIVCSPIKKSYLDFPPALVVEILSPATYLKDKHTKKDLYQEFGIQYYLIVDIDNEIFELFTLDKSGGYIATDKKYHFELTPDCHVTVDLDSIW